MLVATVVACPQAVARVTVEQTAQAAASVRGTLSAASRSGGLTVDQRYRYRRSLRQAMRAVRTLEATAQTRRRDELGSQLVMLAQLASRRALTPARMRPLFRQLDANRVWFAAAGPPKPLARVSIPGDPLVYAYYPSHGLQLQPLFNWSKVNGYWFAKDYGAMQELIDRLAPIAVPQPGGWVSWEYGFDYPGSRAPWLSGMAQAVAIQALARAWQATGSHADLALARRALPGLDRPLAAGGLLGHSRDGRWWPLYAENPSLRVLNGDLQVVISLYDYAAITGDDEARAWAENGAHAAAALLPKYDTGAWSLYEGSRETTLGYHDFMTLQLRQLALKTGNLDFRTYANRFAQYRVTAPVIAATMGATATVYPSVPDGRHGSAGVRAHLDKVSSLRLVVVNARGSIVAKQQLGMQRRGFVTARWNGFTGRRPAAPGVYQFWLRATDLAGNRSPQTFVGAADVERDTEPPEVRRLRIDHVDGRVRLRWRLKDNASAHFTIEISAAGQSVTLHHVPRLGRRTLALPAAGNEFTAAITITDASGNEAWRTRRAS
ncbi:MAG TPA: D-glucuronyl C5-epimerase family protein [Gaiellales bacterium]|nr:D-glucuronyl C5-epimerase family protein [Gaiellales bacterium]